MGEKALNIVKQAVNLALAAGVYKSTQDVVLIHNSLVELQTFVDNSNKANEAIKHDSKVMQEKKVDDTTSKTK